MAVAAAVGGLVALWTFSAGYRLSAGTITLSVSPFHRGALDIYVPLVDWGVRFPGVAMPARLKVGVEAVNRETAASIAHGGLATIDALRSEARDAIASYLKLLALISGAASLALGLLAAAAVRPRHPHPAPTTDGDERPATAGSRGPSGTTTGSAARVAAGLGRARWWAIPAVTVAIGWVLAVALLLPPRGALPNPIYYAHGADIPVALEAIESVGRSSGQVSAGFDAQIQGLARLVIEPGKQPDLSGRPRLTIASDLHNNVLIAPTLQRAAAGGPVLFPGDLTDTGSPLENTATRAVVSTGHPFVFVAGNHDSDTTLQAVARAGGIALTADGRLLASGEIQPDPVVNVDGLRIAGYGSPNKRLARNNYRDRGTTLTAADHRAFAAWFATVEDRVDVVLVHEPALVAPILEQLRRESPARKTSILFVTGDSHRSAVDSADRVTEVNGGTAGAGGTGNLNEGQNAGLAIVTYAKEPFTPLAADLVTLNPGTGETVARRLRLDGPKPVNVQDSG